MIDVFSDTHLDELPFWRARSFVRTILPQRPSPLLCFPGDFSYHNEQNLEFLHALSPYYEVILFLLGNNDTKMNPNLAGYANAGERVQNFLADVQQHIPNAVHLDGTTFSYGGLVFGGSDIYYDFASIQQQFHIGEDAVLAEWHKQRLHEKHAGYIHDPVLHAETQKDQLRELVPLCDVILTHAPPNYFLSPTDRAKGFFRFEASAFIPHLTHKIWLFGHQHERRDETKYGCHFVNASYVGSGQGIQQVCPLPLC